MNKKTQRNGYVLTVKFEGDWEVYGSRLQRRLGRAALRGTRDGCHSLLYTRLSAFEANRKAQRVAGLECVRGVVVEYGQYIDPPCLI